MVILARRFTRRRSFGLRPVNSIKNSFITAFGITGTQTDTIIAKAVNAPLSASGPTELNHGSTIRAIWLSFDFCGLAGPDVLNNCQLYLMKNPGANLTPPAPGSVGTSNEKKFVIRQWSAMTMANDVGNNPYHWEGWIKIPRNYQRMGTDDTWVCVAVCTATLTGHCKIEAIYKWYS